MNEAGDGPDVTDGGDHRDHRNHGDRARYALVTGGGAGIGA